MPELDAIEREAHAWVRRLGAGTARPRDVRALRAWCAASEAHAQAFKNAHRLWAELGPAAKLAAAHDPELAALRAAPRPRAARASMQRRAFMGGGLAASAAAVAGVAWLQAPLLDSWLSPGEWGADYRTGTGEQRQLALAPGVTVAMNTRSSLAVRAQNGEPVGIELLGGEVAVDALGRGGPFTVAAGAGHVRAADARFEVRQTEEQGVCVTCIEGRVQVVVAGEEIALQALQQVNYGRRVLQRVRSLAAGELPAWRDGVLSFQRTALAQVVAEINRYRPGRVVVIGSALEARPVSGRFDIQDLDKAIAQIQRLFRLEATSLPGGIVILR